MDTAMRFNGTYDDAWNALNSSLAMASESAQLDKNGEAGAWQGTTVTPIRQFLERVFFMVCQYRLLYHVVPNSFNLLSDAIFMFVGHDMFHFFCAHPDGPSFQCPPKTWMTMNTNKQTLNLGKRWGIQQYRNSNNFKQSPVYIYISIYMYIRIYVFEVLKNHNE